MNIGFAIGGALSFAAALLHLAIIVGGPNWYRFFGAGEGFAQAAELGHWAPALTTLGVAVVLFVAAGYAWGVSGLAPALRVGADPNLSHRADRILSQGWKPTFRGSAVDKFSS